MFFWVLITLIAFRIGYRHQIAAARNRRIYKKAWQMNHAEFRIHFSTDTDEDIIDFLQYIGSPRVYLWSLVNLDLGKMNKEKLVNRCPERTYCKNPKSELTTMVIELDRRYSDDVIAWLEEAGKSRDTYLKQLVRDDIAYRKAHNLLLVTEAA